MKLERDRHYYDRKGRIWRVVCTDAASDPHPNIAFNNEILGWFTNDGRFYVAGKDNDLDLIRPVFEPGQKWGETDQPKNIYILSGYGGKENWICKYENCENVFRLTVCSEKWILENCEQVKDGPVNQSELSTIKGELRAAEARAELLQKKHETCKDYARKLEQRCGKKSQALADKDREIIRLEYQVQCYQEMTEKMKSTLEGNK